MQAFLTETGLSRFSSFFDDWRAIKADFLFDFRGNLKDGVCVSK